VGQRPHQDAVDDAEHRAVDADPQRECQHCDRGEPRRPRQPASCISNLTQPHALCPSAKYMLHKFRRESPMTRRPMLMTAALVLTAALAHAQTTPKTTQTTPPKPAQPKTTPPKTPAQTPAKTPPKTGTSTAAKKPAATAAASRAALMNPAKLNAVAPPVYKAA